MKVLHIGKYFPPFKGGIENFMADLIEQQVLDGHQVSSIVHNHRSQPFNKECKNDFVLYNVPSYGQVAYAPMSPLFGYYLSKVITSENPDIIHIHMPNLSAFWCLLILKARNIPWIIHWHADVIGSVPDLKIKTLYPFYRVFEKTLLNKSYRVIATSNNYKTSSLPLKPYVNKVEVIPLGIKLDNSDVLRDSAESQHLRLIIIGRLTYYKGHKLILKAISKLKIEGIKFSLNIVGGGELQQDIQNEIVSLNLDEEVSLLGKLSDAELYEELGNSDLLCLPSIERTEAFGVVLLEAMRASKPCLVSDVEGSGMSWVVQDNKTGFVVENNSVDSIVKKLKYITENQELLSLYGKAGRERFEREFSIGVCSKRITEIYNNAIEESS